MQNLLKLSCMNIWGLCPNIFCWIWVFPCSKVSWHCCSMWDKLGWLNWFRQFLCEGLSSFNPKGFNYSYLWSCSLCEGRNSFCTGLISRKLCGFLLMFWLALLHSLFYFFFLCWLPSSSSCTVFEAISSNINDSLD